MGEKASNTHLAIACATVKVNCHHTVPLENDVGLEIELEIVLGLGFWFRVRIWIQIRVRVWIRVRIWIQIRVRVRNRVRYLRGEEGSVPAVAPAVQECPLRSSVYQQHQRQGPMYRLWVRTRQADWRQVPSV